MDMLLLPAEAVFRAAAELRGRAYAAGWLPAESAGIPVISVGNLAVGGTGKTPFSAWLAARCRAQGAKPAIALRGYGGDEPALHRELNPGIPVFVAQRRSEAAHAAAAAGCNVVVVDDGFQHRRLHRDLDIVLFAAGSLAGNHRLLPRGPWREPLAAAARADLLVVTRKAGRSAVAAVESLRQRFSGAGRPHILECEIRPVALTPLAGSRAESVPLGDLRDREVLAVAGIADPAALFADLERAGAKVQPRIFPDHHRYTAAEARALAAAAGGRWVVTTGKDAVKLRGLLAAALPAYVLEQEIRMDGGAELLDRDLHRVLTGGGHTSERRS